MPLPPLPRLGPLAQLRHLPCAWCPDDDGPCERCGHGLDDGPGQFAEAQPDFGGSCMLALYPPPELAEALAVDGGLEPAEMHLTIAYLGDAATVDQADMEAVAAVLAERAPIAGMIAGHARFTGGEQDCIVALADSAALEQLRRDTLVLLAEAALEVPSEHGFTPHLTIKYLDNRDDPDPVGRLEGRPAEFAAVSAVHGSQRTDFPFTDPAGHAGPVAEAATINLASLEGIWADVYGRQDRLFAAHSHKAKTAWRKVTAGLAVAPMVAAFRRHALMQPGAPAPGTDHQSPQARKHHRDELRRLARSMAAGLLIGLADRPAWADVIAAIEAALTAAAGEGVAAALAIAAAEAGHHRFRWAAAAADGAREAGRDAVTAATAAILAGAITDLANALVKAGIAGDSEQDMLAAALQALADARSLGVYLTDAMGEQIAAAMRDVYLAAGVTLLDWVTAGDDRVCAVPCQDHEDHNPWRAEDFPPMPAHPKCVIGSTRVSAPPLVVVATDEAHRLALDPAQRAVGALGDGCAPAATAVAEAVRDFGRGNIRAVTDREYVGDVITIRTARGHELTVTPNHPVATRGGWVAAAELTVGSDVLCSTSAEWEVDAVDPDIDHVPPRIEDVAQAFPVVFGAMPVAAEDFHGDGQGSEVCVVRADRLLVDHENPMIAEHLCEHDLGRGDVAVVGTEILDAEGLGSQELSRLGLASDGVVGGCSQPGALRGARSGHAGVHAGTAVAGFDPGLQEPVADDRAADAESLAERLLALASLVPGDDGCTVDVGGLLATTTAPAGNTGLDQALAHGFVVSAESVCDLPEGSPLGIAADQVVHVERHWLEAHVYNLDTAAGYYIGNGIVVHNCRCIPMPAGHAAVPDAFWAPYLSDAA
jgi:2'-5' RNA ligase